MANRTGMYYFKIKPTILFKFSDASDELIYNLRIQLVAVNHLELCKESGSRFAKSSEQCPSVTAFKTSNEYCSSSLTKFLSISGIEQSVNS